MEKNEAQEIINGFNSAYLTREEVIMIFSVFNCSVYTSIKTYQSMKKTSDDFYKKNNLKNPQIKAIPKVIADSYFKSNGITADSLKERLDWELQKNDESNN